MQHAGDRGEGGAKSYDGEKAWSSINLSMLSGKKTREGRRKKRKEIRKSEGKIKMEYNRRGIW
jgi:hypothetical protein